MKSTIFIFFLFFFFNVSAQRVQRINSEIKSMFLDTLHSWDNLIEKAQTENKFIYLFCRSSGSANGYILETEYFPQSIKNFLTSNFILLNIEVDYSRKDEYLSTITSPRFIDSLRKVESILNRSIFLIYDKHGNPLAKSLFSFPDTAYRITYLKEILRGKNRYYPLLKEFKEGNRTANFIQKFNRAYKGAVIYSVEDTVRIFEQFIKAYPGKSLFTKSNGKLIYDNADLMLFDVCSRNLFLNRKEWYKILGKQKVDDRIIELLCSDFEITALLKNNYDDKNKSFEKTKEEYLISRSEYKEYNDIVFSRSLKKLLSN